MDPYAHYVPGIYSKTQHRGLDQSLSDFGKQLSTSSLTVMRSGRDSPNLFPKMVNSNVSRYYAFCTDIIFFE